MADEALRLQAQVVDQFSQPIRDMQRQLRLLTESNRRTHIEGARQVQTHTKAYGELRLQVMQTARHLQGDFEPVIRTLGTAATAAGLSFGALAAGIGTFVAAGAGAAFVFQGTAHHARDMSRATDLAVNDLRVFEALGPRIGSSVEGMDSALVQLSGHMETLKLRPFAEQASEAAAEFTPQIQAQVKAIRDLTRPEQIQKLFEIGTNIGATQGVAYKRRFFEYFFGGTGDQLANYSANELRTLSGKIKEYIRPLTADQIQMGVDADMAWMGLRERMGGFVDYLGASFIPYLLKAYDATDAFIKNVKDAVATYEPIVEGYLTGAETFFTQWKGQFEQSDVGQAIQRQVAAIKAIDWTGLGDQLGKAMIPNFADLKAKLQDGNLPGYFTDLWANILAINTTGSQTVGGALKENLAQLKTDLTDFLNDPMVKDPFKGLGGDGSAFAQIRASLPSWKGPIADLRDLIHTTTELTTIIDDLAAHHKIDWDLIFDVSGFKQIGDDFEKSLESGPLHKFRVFFDWLNAKGGVTPPSLPLPGAQARPVTPTPAARLPEPPPSIKLAPSNPTEPPASVAPSLKQPMLKPSAGYSRISFEPDEAPQSPGGVAQTAGGGKSDAVQIIAAGTRKGVYDGLFDFYNAMQAAKTGGAIPGVTPASFETGPGGAGAGAGGPDGGEGGGGGGRGGAGAGGRPGGRPSGRRGGGGGPGDGAPELPAGTGQPLLDEISRSEGTRGYNDAFAHQHPGVDLSKMTVDQVEALSKSQRGSSAIGRYQFMSYTLDSLKKQLHLSGSEMFNPAMQDRLARSLLQRRGYDQWKAGKLSDQAFMHNLSQEWAGLTDPNTGHGFYPGQTTGHSLKEQFTALKAERDKAKVAATPDASPLPAGPKPKHVWAPGEWAYFSKRLQASGMGTPEGKRSQTPYQGDPTDPAFDKDKWLPYKKTPWSPGLHAIDPHKEQEASLRGARGDLLGAAQKAGMFSHKVTGEASIKVALDQGLVGKSTKAKGSLFKEISLDRGAMAAASTMG